MTNHRQDNYSTNTQQPEQELLDLVNQWQKSASHSQRISILKEITIYIKYPSKQKPEKISVREMAQTVDILLAKYPGILKITKSM
ncbi:MAG: hypothetical protein AAF208_05120 [Cyanobacteria bacterium P01_A01_bin.45]